jgi:diguanylate cyclase (GGDEF)-like protein
MIPRPRSTATPAVRLAQRAWRLLHLDAATALTLAERALARAQAAHDGAGEAWARLARGFHMLYFSAPADAGAELALARRCFASQGDRGGEILAAAGMGRSLWRSGRFAEAQALLLPLRDEGLALLKHEQRGVLLNAIAGCWSAQGRSEEAFAYMYEALRDAGPRRGHGFDAALYCNLSHELLQLGDYDEALANVERGIARCEGMRNARLVSVLLINRTIALTELGRAGEALADVHRIVALPADASGRGVSAAAFETLAICALRAGEAGLGADLIARAHAGGYVAVPDEHVELAVAEALLAARQGRPHDGLQALARVQPYTEGDDASASLRVRCQHAQVASDLHEALGDSAAALAALRRWQALHRRRAQLASRARYQAAALQTELLELRHRLEENEAKRLATERAHAELTASNQALQRKIAEVQSLQAALREQATHDGLTGLFNRRHLNDTLPTLLALALREHQPLAAVVIDLDHFKRINDTHGHPAGDALLVQFGRLLREHLRRSDMAFRYGGEEFCLLLPHTTAAAARAKAEQLLDAWRVQQFQLDGGMLAGQTFSAGAADTLLAGTSPAALLRAADNALLAAKRAGRNRVRAVAAGGDDADGGETLEMPA